MIQRLQSIYLLVAAILMAVTICSPLAFLGGEDNIFYLYQSLGFYENGVALKYPTWGVIAFAVLGAIIPFVTIFLYKNRRLQLRLSYVTVVCIAAFYVAHYIYMQTGLEAVSASLISVKYGTILPAIALIFTILAIFRIKTDEKLIQSMNRIR